MAYGGCETEFVVVSAATDQLSGPETFIFPADGDGKVLAWQELPGSFRGELNFDKAIRQMCEDYRELKEMEEYEK